MSGYCVKEGSNMAATIIIELSEDSKLSCVHAVATAVDAHTDSGGLHIS